MAEDRSSFKIDPLAQHQTKGRMLLAKSRQLTTADEHWNTGGGATSIGSADGDVVSGGAVPLVDEKAAVAAAAAAAVSPLHHSTSNKSSESCCDGIGLATAAVVPTRRPQSSPVVLSASRAQKNSSKETAVNESRDASANGSSASSGLDGATAVAPSATHEGLSNKHVLSKGNRQTHRGGDAGKKVFTASGAAPFGRRLHLHVAEPSHDDGKDAARTLVLDQAMEGVSELTVSVVDEFGPETSKLGDVLRSNLPRYLLGVVVLCAAALTLFLGEMRSVRLEALRARGFEECTSVSGDAVDKANRGRLVHLQGRTRAAGSLSDPRFPDLEIPGCVKLQSTVEVLEHVPISRSANGVGDGTWPPATPKRRVRTRVEWTPVHRDFREHGGKKSHVVAETPPPGGVVNNPDLPLGLRLGTVTSNCGRVELGGYVMPEELVGRLQRYEQAMSRMPDTVRACGVVFYANRSDGYYYGRPTQHIRQRSGGFFAVSALTRGNVRDDHAVGDLRARFLCVPEGEATVVGVQCGAEGGDETFVPYRSIAQRPCLTEAEQRKLLVDGGTVPLGDFLSHQEVSMCLSVEKGHVTSGVLCCFCFCPCNVLSCICGQEVVTEEVFYASDRAEPKERAFRQVVPRTCCRVLSYRLICWLGLVAALWLLLGPSMPELKAFLQIDGLSHGGGRLLILFSLASALLAVTSAAASAPFLPSTSMKCLIIAACFLSLPMAVARYLNHQVQ